MTETSDPSGSLHLPWDVSRTAQVASELFVEGPIVARSFQRWRPHISPFEALLPLVPPGSSVLDVGCGAGLLLGLLARAGRIGHGIGFDSSHAAIALAGQMQAQLQKLDADAASRLQFLRLDVSDPWPSGEYDVVCVIDVMHHVPPSAWRAVVSQMASRVKRGGRLIYKDMCCRPRWRAMMNRLHDLTVARQWVNHVPVAMIEQWATEENLMLIESRDISRLWYGHELRVFERRATNSEGGRT